MHSHRTVTSALHIQLHNRHDFVSYECLLSLSHPHASLHPARFAPLTLFYVQQSAVVQDASPYYLQTMLSDEEIVSLIGSCSARDSI